MPGAAQSYQELSRAASSFPKLTRATQNCLELLRATQSYPKMPGAAQSCQELPRATRCFPKTELYSVALRVKSQSVSKPAIKPASKQKANHPVKSKQAV